MPNRVDLRWSAPVLLREQHWAWRHDITDQVVNPEIDGLMTACLMHHLKGWKVIGFYDTARLMLDSSTPLPLDLRTTAFVDVDMCWPGARSLSQHVIRDLPADRSTVNAYATTVNPSLLLGKHSRALDYRTKYPFGTFQWTWHLAGQSLGPPPGPDERLLTGLAWMPDGGFMSVRHEWRANCIDWAVNRMQSSILEPLARTKPDHAEALVIEAAEHLRARSGVTRGWRNHQFALMTGSRTGPRLTMPIDEELASMQALCDAICEIYGWQSLSLPRRVETLIGTYHSTATPPPGWPEAANRREVVSMAVTRARQFCWTGPGELGAGLPDIS